MLQRSQQEEEYPISNKESPISKWERGANRPPEDDPFSSVANLEIGYSLLDIGYSMTDAESVLMGNGQG